MSYKGDGLCSPIYAWYSGEVMLNFALYKSSDNVQEYNEEENGS
jgi:hypothetical protein